MPVFILRPHGQAVKTSPFHGGNSGSIPDGVTIFFKTPVKGVFYFQKLETNLIDKIMSSVYTKIDTELYQYLLISVSFAEEDE